MTIKNLALLFTVAITLTACNTKSNHAPKVNIDADVIDLHDADGNLVAQQYCIKGVAYYGIGSSLTVAQGVDGKSVACSLK